MAARFVGFENHFFSIYPFVICILTEDVWTVFFAKVLLVFL